MKPINERISSLIYRWLMKNQPAELRALIEKVSDEKAQSVALQTTMMYLDRMGFTHCAFCPQRFGLRRVAHITDGNRTREDYLCTAHFREQERELVSSNGHCIG